MPDTDFEKEELDKINQNLLVWDRFKTPPSNMLTPIIGGRLGSCGFSDINAQWRLECLTALFGPCGIGWKYDLVKEWIVPAGTEGEILQFVELHLSYKMEKRDGWSDIIPVYGSSFLAEKERRGLHLNEHCLKSAITDALGAACTKLGIASDVYMGKIEEREKEIEEEFKTFTKFLMSIQQVIPTQYIEIQARYLPLVGLKGDNDRQVAFGNELKKAIEMAQRKGV